MIKVHSRKDFLTEVAKQIPCEPHCIELGVYKGEFSELILNALKPELLYLVDPFETNNIIYPDGGTTAYSTADDYWKLINHFRAEESVTIYREYSYSLHPYLINNSFNFIYVDASHLYEDVKKDLTDYLPKLSKDGLMCGHDYGSVFDGVKKAVDEFCNEHNFEMIILNENGGDYALRAIQ